MTTHNHEKDNDNLAELDQAFSDAEAILEAEVAEFVTISSFLTGFALSKDGRIDNVPDSQAFLTGWIATELTSDVTAGEAVSGMMAQLGKVDSRMLTRMSSEGGKNIDHLHDSWMNNAEYMISVAGEQSIEKIRRLVASYKQVAEGDQTTIEHLINVGGKDKIQEVRRNLYGSAAAMYQERAHEVRGLGIGVSLTDTYRNIAQTTAIERFPGIPSDTLSEITDKSMSMLKGIFDIMNANAPDEYRFDLDEFDQQVSGDRALSVDEIHDIAVDVWGVFPEITREYDEVFYSLLIDDYEKAGPEGVEKAEVIRSTVEIVQKTGMTTVLMGVMLLSADELGSSIAPMRETLANMGDSDLAAARAIFDDIKAEVGTQPSGIDPRIIEYGRQEGYPEDLSAWTFAQKSDARHYVRQQDKKR